MYGACPRPGGRSSVPPPAPGVTGKRFVVALEDGPGAGRELADAVDRFAPGKLLDGARGGQSA